MRTDRAPYGRSLAIFEEMLAVETDECIDWPFGRLASGYGSIDVAGRRHRVHRLACERVHGPPPDPTMDAAHSCGRRICFNPRHLRWATRRENSADAAEHGTLAVGERLPQAKLTPEQVRKIMVRYAASGISQRALAAEYGVDQSTISHIVKERTWRSVTNRG